MSESINDATLETPPTDAPKVARPEQRSHEPAGRDTQDDRAYGHESPDDYDPAEDYRALSAAAVSTFALGLLSPLAFLDMWLGLVPIAALMLGFVALRQIGKRPEEFTGKKLAIAGIALALVFLIGGGTYQGFVYSNELPGPDFVRASYAELQPYEGDPWTKLSPETVALDGKKILIKGYVFPGQRQSGITQFLLVRDQGDCCFGGNPKVTDRILVSLKDTKGFDFSGKSFKVAGEFHIAPPMQAADAQGVVLYHLVNAELR
jgi:hypothetical protein